MRLIAGEDQKRRWLSVLDATLLLALSGLAFYLTYIAGRRGLYPFDQSILFDGSYRILTGQIPYRDFVLPFGPMAFWLHALFFKLLGVSYFSYLVGAGVVNALAALSSVIVIRSLFPSMRLLSYVGGVLTAVWFYPPFGTPWVDQTAFFLSYLALAALLTPIVTCGRDSSKHNLLIALSGCLAFGSFISKQNVGAFMFPLYPLLVVAAGINDRRQLARRLGIFAAGIGASTVGFVVWLHLESDPGRFNEYFFKIASGLGTERLASFARAWFGVLRPFFGGRGSPVINVIMLVSLAVGLLALVRALHDARTAGTKSNSGRLLAGSVTCVYCILFQHVFINTTLNQPENALAFAGTVFAIAMGLLIRLMDGRASGDDIREVRAPIRSAITARLIVGMVVAAAVVFASISGIEVAMDRKVHDILRGSEYPRPIAVDKLRPLRWAQPTLMGGFEIREESVIRLYRYLKERGQNFFIFPDFTFLYGLLGVPSPQPVLWFHRGVTYTKGANSDLDRWIIDDLEKNDVTIFVLEQVSWFNTGERWNDFPQMKAYVMSNFDRVGQIGTFSVYEKPGPDR